LVIPTPITNVRLLMAAPPRGCLTRCGLPSRCALMPAAPARAHRGARAWRGTPPRQASVMPARPRSQALSHELVHPAVDLEQGRRKARAETAPRCGAGHSGCGFVPRTMRRSPRGARAQPGPPATPPRAATRQKPAPGREPPCKWRGWSERDRANPGRRLPVPSPADGRAGTPPFDHRDQQAALGGVPRPFSTGARE
jgi:hypothetical protein